MWVGCLVFLMVILCWKAWQGPPSTAVGYVAVLALLFPTWLQSEIFGFEIDLRVASGIIALCVYCLHKRSVFNTKLVAVDFAVLMLVIVHVLSDFTNDGPSIVPLLIAYGEWIVPYLMGRLALQRWDDVERLVPIAVLVCVMLSLESVYESLSHQNVFEIIFGACPDEKKYLFRSGIMRAFGPTMNPIYFGSLILGLMPWTIFAAWLGLNRNGSVWYMATPIITFIGIVCTMSRAPILSTIPLVITILAYTMPKWRITLLTTVIIFIAVFSSNPKIVLDWMHRWTGDYHTQSESRAKIHINGEEVDYSSTLHRVYLFKVYGTAMRRAGLLGFGTVRTDEFPPNVPMGADHDVETQKRLWCVDNQYILYILRFGYLGLLCFLATALTAMLAYRSIEHSNSRRQRFFAAAMTSGIVSTLLILLTVWMPQDFGYWLIWTIGGSAGMLSSLVRNPQFA